MESMNIPSHFFSSIPFHRGQSRARGGQRRRVNGGIKSKSASPISDSERPVRHLYTRYSVGQGKSAAEPWASGPVLNLRLHECENNSAPPSATFPSQGLTSVCVCVQCKSASVPVGESPALSVRPCVTNVVANLFPLAECNCLFCTGFQGADIQPYG